MDCFSKAVHSAGILAWSPSFLKRFQDAAEWTAFEKQSIAEYEKAVAEAEKLLRRGKKAQAVTLLNQTAAGIWEKAYPLAVLP